MAALHIVASIPRPGMSTTTDCVRNHEFTSECTLTSRLPRSIRTRDRWPAMWLRARRRFGDVGDRRLVAPGCASIAHAAKAEAAS
jgi:hypothetical protein